MSVLKIRDEKTGNFIDIPTIKGKDGAIQYEAGDNIKIENNVISATCGGGSASHIADGANNSLIANDIITNEIKTNNYIDSQGVFHEITEDVILIDNLNTVVQNAGYYAVKKELTTPDGFGYGLYQFNDNAIGQTIEFLINPENTSNYGLWLTNTYNYNAKNISVFGTENLGAGDGSIITGNNNKNSGYNSLVLGKNNINNAGEAVVAGLENKNLGGSSAVFGSYNNVNDNQGFVSGFHNKISTGSNFSTAIGTGNVTKGVANFTSGAYNYTGADYNTAIGYGNTVGGEIKYDGELIKNIPTYNSNNIYTLGAMTKLNGVVYKSKIGDNTKVPSPKGTEEYWDVIVPTTTKGTQTNSFVGGRNNIVKNSNSFVYGSNLTSGRANQTVIGKNNVERTNADFVIGNGQNDVEKHNSFEVRSSERETKAIVDAKGTGNKTLVLSKDEISQLELRANKDGVGTLAVKGGLYIKPYSEAEGYSDTYGLLYKDKIYPLTDDLIDLGASSKRFKNLYISGSMRIGHGQAVTTNTEQTISGKKKFTGKIINVGDIRNAISTRAINGNNGTSSVADGDLYLQYGKSYGVKFGSSANSQLNADGTITIAEATQNNQAVTKGYVDKIQTDSLKGFSGYDANKIQILKNINGTFTWVSEN